MEGEVDGEEKDQVEAPEEDKEQEPLEEFTSSFCFCSPPKANPYTSVLSFSIEQER